MHPPLALSPPRTFPVVCCLSPNLFKCHLQRSVALKPAARPRTARSLNSTLPSDIPLSPSLSSPPPPFAYHFSFPHFSLCSLLSHSPSPFSSACLISCRFAASADVRSSIFFRVLAAFAVAEGAGATKSILYVFCVRV